MNLPEKFKIGKVLKKLGKPLKRILFYKINLLLQSKILLCRTKINIPKLNLPASSFPNINIPNINIRKSQFDLPKFIFPTFNLPEFNPPKFNMPRIKFPVISVPKFNLPPLNFPKLNIPKLRFTLPKLNRPSFNPPKFSIPTVKLPEIRLPDINLQKPKINLPSFQIPEIQLPTIESPRINFKLNLKIVQKTINLWPKPKINLPKPNLTWPKISFDFKRISNSSQMISPESVDRLFTIGKAAKMLGVSITTLRRWDKSGRLKIGRTPSGYRVFGEVEINALKRKMMSGAKSISFKQILPSGRQAYSSLSSQLRKILAYKYFPLFALIAIVLVLSPLPHFLDKISGNKVLGIETFIVPVIAEGGPIGNILGKVGSFFKGGSFVVPLVGKSEPSTGEDLKVKGKATFARDIESLGDLIIKGTATVGKLKTGIVDPYLIENDGVVEPTLTIRTLHLGGVIGSADIVFEPGGIEKLRIKETGNVVFSTGLSVTSANLSENINFSSTTPIISIGDTGTLKITDGTNTLLSLSDSGTKGNLETSGDLKVSGNLTLSGSFNSNTFSSTKIVLAGDSPAIYAGTEKTAIALDAGTTGAVNIASSSTGDINLGGGSGSTGCTITNSNGNFSCSGDISVNGGDLLTSATTFNLLNVTATTLNVGGAATTVSLGASTGTTTINNALTVTGATTLTDDLAVNGGDITTTATTFNLVNAATTFNIGSTAVTRTINIGTGTGADTIHIGEGGTTANTITIGTDAVANTITIGTTTASEALSLADDNWNITAGGLANFVSIGAATAGTGAFTTISASGAIAANGGITFDASTDTLGAFTLGGTLDASTQIITNIGNTGTDFVASTGALTLAGVLTANGGVTIAGGQNLALSSGTGTYTQTNAQTTDASADAMTLTLSAGGTGATGTLRGLVISQSDTATTGVFDSLMYITNLKTPETTTNGLLIDQNAASGTLTNALHITNTAGTLTTAILIDGTAPGTNILDTGSIDISGAGAVSGVTTLTATTLAGTLSTAAQASVTSVGTLTSLAVTGNINSSTGALQTNGVTRIDNSGNLTAGTGSFAGSVSPSAGATYDLGTAVLTWRDAYFSGDVTAGDLVFKNNFRFTENGDKGINILNPKGEVIGGFDNEGNLWMKGEIKQWGKN